MWGKTLPNGLIHTYVCYIHNAWMRTFFFFFFNENIYICGIYYSIILLCIKLFRITIQNCILFYLLRKNSKNIIFHVYMHMCWCFLRSGFQFYCIRSNLLAPLPTNTILCLCLINTITICVVNCNQQPYICICGHDEAIEILPVNPQGKCY